MILTNVDQRSRAIDLNQIDELKKITKSNQ